MDEYIAVNMEIQRIFQNYGSPDDIYPYSIDEGFIDLTSSLNYFISDKSLSRKDKLDLLSAPYSEGYLEADRNLLYSRYVQCQSLTSQDWLWIMKPSTLRP